MKLIGEAKRKYQWEMRQRFIASTGDGRSYITYLQEKGLTVEEFTHPRDGKKAYRLRYLDGRAWP